METIFKVKYNGEFAWGYELINTVNGMWYVGIGQGDINTYDTGSYNPELMSAISRGEIVRYIVWVDGSYDSTQVWETELLHERDAENDPMSYNESNGMSPIKTLPRIDMCYDIAQEIRKHNSYCNNELTVIDLRTEKEFIKKKGVLKLTSFLRDLDALQPRHKIIDGDHLSELTELIDQYKGNLNAIEEATEQTLFCVVLKNRKQKNKPPSDLRIDGNHTFKATIVSRYGWTLKILYIPESIHNDWSEDEIRLIGEYLNPRDVKTVLETAEEDAVKTAFELAKKYGKDSSLINDYLVKHKFVAKAKDRIKANVTRQMTKLDEERSRPKNFIDYKDPEDMETLKDKVEEYKKEPNTHSVCWSSSKAAIGDYASKMLKIIYDGKKNVKTIKLVIYHPSMVAMNKFKKEYEHDFKNWKRLFKHEYVDLQWEEAPFQRDE